MKKILTIILLLFIVILNSCTKPKEVLTISDEMKDYIMFPTGSYWIYEDTVTGEVDSINLVEQFIDTQECFSCGQIYYENLRQIIYSSKSSSYYDNSMQIYPIYDGNKFILVYGNEFSTEFEQNTDSLVYFLQTFTLNNLNYNNVFVLQDYFKVITSIWAEGVGRIKFMNDKIFTDTSYSYFILKRYYINNK